MPTIAAIDLRFQVDLFDLEGSLCGDLAGCEFSHDSKAFSLALGGQSSAALNPLLLPFLFLYELLSSDLDQHYLLLSQLMFDSENAISFLIIQFASLSLKPFAPPCSILFQAPSFCHY